MFRGGTCADQQQLAGTSPRSKPPFDFFGVALREGATEWENQSGLTYARIVSGQRQLFTRATT
jgi:hypothetical protein